MTTDLQLDIWNQLLMKKVDVAQEKLQHVDLCAEPAKYGRLQGYIDGLLESVTLLGVVEKGKRMKADIDGVKANLLLENDYDPDGNYIAPIKL